MNTIEKCVLESIVGKCNILHAHFDYFYDGARVHDMKEWYQDLNKQMLELRDQVGEYYKLVTQDKPS